MSNKELLYIEDSLSHAEFLTARCRDAASQLKDPSLKAEVEGLQKRYSEIFSKFYSLV